MKITQLDYSAMMSANSARLASESDARNNRALARSNALNAANNINTPKANAISEKLAELQTSAQRTNAIANIINSTLNVAQAGISLASTIHQAKIASDETEANNAMIKATNELNTYIAQNPGSLISVGDDGTISITDEFRSYLSSFDDQIAGSNWDKSVKQSAYGSWAKMAGAAAVSVTEKEVSRYQTQTRQNDSYMASEIYQADIASGKASPEGVISFWQGKKGKGLYSDAEIDGLVLQATQSYKSDGVKNSALGELYNGSYSKALQLVDDSDLSNEEKLSLRNTLAQQNSALNAQLATSAGSSFAGMMEQGISPSQARQNIKDSFAYDSKDKDAQDAIDKALDIQQTSYIEKLFPQKNYDSWSQSRLKVEKETISKNKDLFAGMETAYTARIKTIDDRMQKLAALDEETKTELQKQRSETGLSSFSQNATSIKTAVADGTTSPMQASKVLDASYENTLDAFRKSLSIRNKDGESLKGVDGRLILTASAEKEYSLFEDALYQDYMTEQSELMKVAVPEQLQDYYKNLESNLTEHFIPQKEKNKMTDEDKRKAYESEQRVRSYIRSEILSLPQEQMTADKLTDIFDRGIQSADKNTASIIVDIGTMRTAPALQGVYGDIYFKNMKELSAAFRETPDLVFRNPEGGYTFAGDNIQSAYNEYGTELARILKEQNIMNEDGSNKAIIQPSIIDGKLTPQPEILIGDKAYTADGSYLYERDKSSREWSKVMSLHDYKGLLDRDNVYNDYPRTVSRRYITRAVRNDNSLQYM